MVLSSACTRRGRRPSSPCAAIGAAFGTAKSGIGITGLGTFRPELVMRSLIPVVMSGIIAVYGLVISVLIAGARAYHVVY